MKNAPIQITSDYHPAGYKPEAVSFVKLESMFEAARKKIGFEGLSIDFDDDYKRLRGRALRDPEFLDFTFTFPRSKQFLDRIIKLFSASVPNKSITLPFHLLDRYSLVPKRSKAIDSKSKPISIEWFMGWGDSSLNDLETLLEKKTEEYSLDLVSISPSDTGLFWNLMFSHHIHHDDSDRIHLKSPAAKQSIALILAVLDKEPFSCPRRIRLSCLSSFTIRKGTKPKKSKVSEAVSDDDIPF